LNDEHCLYAEELAAKLPEGLDCIYFASSGSEANAMATQFARIYTENYPVVVLKNGYHGMGGTQHLTNVNSWNHNIPKTHGIETSAFPDMFRGPWAHADAAGKMYAQDVKDTIEFCTSGKVALFMAEPIMGVGGLCPQPDGFVKEAASHVKAAGGLYLSDEVQTGFGRTGGHYWGFEMLGS
jgi:alanine-glyoxylate transaminase/(R)-3-amino-2-methylpropionate-pyruvate transaminase